jgi:hypothetical protein
MSQKTIIQRARGYNSSPVTATVKIDGNVIYQGEIPTVNSLPPILPDDWSPELGVDSWSWTVPEYFNGTCDMTVDVDNGILYLYGTFYTLLSQPDEVFSLIYKFQDGDLEIEDPITDVKINDRIQLFPRNHPLTGQWVWKLEGGNSFSCKVNIVPPWFYVT